MHAELDHQSDRGSATSGVIAPARHAELARRICIAVTSYQTAVSYATMEKRMEGQEIDHSWEVVAEKIFAATQSAVSERLLAAFR
jgi:hypothetical protein